MPPLPVATVVDFNAELVRLASFLTERCPREAQPEVRRRHRQLVIASRDAAVPVFENAGFYIFALNEAISRRDLRALLATDVEAHLRAAKANAAAAAQARQFAELLRSVVTQLPPADLLDFWGSLDALLDHYLAAQADEPAD